MRRRPPAEVIPEWARRLEIQSLILQSLLAGLFSLAIRGRGDDALACAIAVNLYHLLRVIYVLVFRIHGRSFRMVEWTMPILDILCITGAWIVMNDAGSPFWGLYVYAIVSYGQRLGVRSLVAFTAFIVVNMAAALVQLGVPVSEMTTDVAPWTMVAILIATGTLTRAMGTAWFGAEHNARRLAHTDPLTGIGNRRWVTDCLEELDQDGEPYSVLMMDLDDFKQINDEFGHDVGDSVLVRASALIADNLRPGDIFGRFGGEEFVVVLPNSGLAEARAVAERLRQKVRAGTPTSISVGCSVRSPGDSPAEVIQKADALMLIAKRTGKNAVRSELALVA